MDLNDLEKRSGIYLIILEKWGSYYIGRTNNLKRRLTQHLIEGSHKKKITQYLKLFDDIQYMVLEYTNNYKARDQAIIEKHWIEHYKRKGMKLLNKTDPTKECFYKESKPIIQTDFLGNILNEFASINDASKQLNINVPNLVACLKHRQHSAKNSWFFYKDSEFEMKLFIKLRNKKQKDSKAEKSKQIKFKIAQYDKDLNLIKYWKRITEASRDLSIARSNIILCAKGIRKSAGGYIWKYVEESEG